MIDFDKSNSNSIKSLAVKKNINVKVKSRFMNGKMLTFAKISLASFFYDVIDVFALPKEQVRGIYDQNDIIKCLIYTILTENNSASLFFVFFYKIDCFLTENLCRKLIFEILTESKLLERLDRSVNSWVDFNVYATLS